MESKHIVAEEEKQIKALQNELIEIEMGTKDALRLIKQELI